MRDLGQIDAIVRNYKLEHPRANDNHNFTYQACKRIGLEVRKGNWNYALDEVVARLRAMEDIPDRNTVRIRLNEWYIWDRIRMQELRQWRRLDLASGTKPEQTGRQKGPPETI